MSVPLRFQSETYVKIEEDFPTAVLLCWEMGLGKTVMSAIWSRRNPEARPIVVVCPASLRWNWQNEIVAHMKCKSQILEGMKPYEIVEDIVIISYNVLQYWKETLRGICPKLIVMDECQYLMNPSAKRTKAAKELCREIKYRFALSGTPIMNRPIELFPVLNMLCPDVFNSLFEFGQRYCGPEFTHWGWQYRGATNLKELHKLLKATCMVRILKKDVLEDLPEKRRIIVPLEIEDRKQYVKARDHFLQWLGETSLEKARRAAKAVEFVKLGYMLKLVAELKMKPVLEWVDNFLSDTDEKLMLFAHHKSIVGTLHEKYKDISTMVNGSVVGQERQRRFDKFNDDPKCRIIVANIQAGGVGWNSKHNNTALVQFPWRPADVAQLEDRSHGIERGKKGQSSNYYFLYARNTVEEKLCMMLQSKQDVADKTLDGESGATGFDISELIEEIKHEL